MTVALIGFVKSPLSAVPIEVNVGELFLNRLSTPDNHPCAQIDHDGQIHPPLRGAQVGDVAAQIGCRHRWVETAPKQISTCARLRVLDRGAFKRATVLGVQRVVSHDLSHRIQRGCNVLGLKLPVDSARPGKTVVLVEDLDNQIGNRRAFRPRCATGRRSISTLAPGVIAGAGYFQHTAHH